MVLDSKSLCGVLDSHGRTMQLLALVDKQTGYIHSQMQVDDKTNESKAAPELLQTLVLNGRVITADALLCQREISQQIVDGGGHYLLVVKDNQPELKQAITAEISGGPFPPRPRSSGKLTSIEPKQSTRGMADENAEAYKLPRVWPVTSTGRAYASKLERKSLNTRVFAILVQTVFSQSYGICNRGLPTDPKTRGKLA